MRIYMSQPINNAHLSHSNPNHIKDKIKLLSQFKQQLQTGNTTQHDKALKLLDPLLKLLSSFYTASNALPQPEMMSSLLDMISAIESVEANFFEEHLGPWNKRKKTQFNTLTQLLQNHTSPNQNIKNTPQNTSQLDAAIQKINKLLANGIENIDELIDLMKLMNQYGLRIPPKLMQKISEKIQSFLQSESQKFTCFTEVAAFMTTVQSMLSPAVSDIVINPTAARNEFEAQGLTPSSPHFSINPINDDHPTPDSSFGKTHNTQPNSDLSASDPPATTVAIPPLKKTVASSKKITDNRPNRVNQINRTDKITPIDKTSSSTADYLAIRSQIISLTQNTKSLFISQLIDTISPYFESLLVDQLGTINQQLDPNF